MFQNVNDLPFVSFHIRYRRWWFCFLLFKNTMHSCLYDRKCSHQLFNVYRVNREQLRKTSKIQRSGTINMVTNGLPYMKKYLNWDIYWVFFRFWRTKSGEVLVYLYTTKRWPWLWLWGGHKQELHFFILLSWLCVNVSQSLARLQYYFVTHAIMSVTYLRKVQSVCIHYLVVFVFTF